jgi:dTDP-4-amino-4,6-dideoxygalactose transaminase
MIPFNIPLVTGKESGFIRKTIQTRKFSGDGNFNTKCQCLIEARLECKKVFLTPSCTAALEMAALLCDIKEGDEIIMPSFTFPSSANAFVLRGARIVFTDICPDTMNIDESLVEAAITEKTKAIVVVHYGGISCDMEKLKALSEKHKLFLIEDAAHAYQSKFNNKFLGTFGDIGCISFHETKNIHCGEGGAILINNPIFIKPAEIIREKGTDRSRYQRGETDKYTWIEKGSSFLLSEINAAFLYAQLQYADKVISKRKIIWDTYYNELESICKHGKLELATIPTTGSHNGHIFFIKCKDFSERNNLIKYLNKSTIFPASHYLPLHSSKAGQNFGRFQGKDKWTTQESLRLLRLPMFYQLTRMEVKEICAVIHRFYETKT